MASITLVESTKFTNDLLVKGVARDFIEIDPLFNYLPMLPITSDVVRVNREKTLAGVNTYDIGDPLANTAATYESVTYGLSTLGGIAEVDGRILATNATQVDQMELALSSVAKATGRKYRNLFINGDSGSVTTDFDGLANLVSAGQTIAATGADGDVFTFAKLDEGIAMTTAKDGDVDFITMTSREINAMYAAYRNLGGAGIVETMTLPSGRQIPMYRGIPIFRNDFIPVNQVVGSASNSSSIYFGCFDDGTMKTGLAGITSAVDGGIQVIPVGQSETKNAQIAQVIWYAGLMLASDKALTAVTGIVPAA